MRFYRLSTIAAAVCGFTLTEARFFLLIAVLRLKTFALDPVRGVNVILGPISIGDYWPILPHRTRLKDFTV